MMTRLAERTREAFYRRLRCSPLQRLEVIDDEKGAAAGKDFEVGDRRVHAVPVIAHAAERRGQPFVQVVQQPARITIGRFGVIPGGGGVERRRVLGQQGGLS